MSDLELVTDSIDVPKNTGIEGFIQTIRQILRLPRVQTITVNARGKVSYDRYVAEGDPDQTIGVDFSGIEPAHIVRNALNGVVELVLQAENSAVILMGMLDWARTEKFHPIAFVTGANTTFWSWYAESTRTSLAARDSICGLPVYFDRHIPDTALILCASLAKDGALIDTHKAYKIEMSPRLAPRTEVEVLNV